MTALTVPLPSSWPRREPTADETAAGVRLVAESPQATVLVGLAPVGRPRLAISASVRAYARAEAEDPAVITSYVDLPTGRAVLAHTGEGPDHRGVGQLWLPIGAGTTAVVVTVVTADPRLCRPAADLALAVGRRLTVEAELAAA